MLKKITIIIFIIITLYAFLLSPILFYRNINDTLRIWCLLVFPSIFTFCIISKILLKLNVLKPLSYIIYPFVKFDTSKSYEILLVSFFLGNPGTAVLIMNELKQKSISKDDANFLLHYASFMNPLFIITIVTSYFKSLKLALMIILINTISILLLMIFKKRKKHEVRQIVNNNCDFNLNFLLDTVDDVTKLLINIAGIMVLANIIKYSLENLIAVLFKKNRCMVFLTSLIEISVGSKDIINTFGYSSLTISLLCFLFSFQGISINLQVMNVTKDFFTINENSRFLLTRLKQAFIAFFMAFFIF